ncbi:MAG: hypothetical protein LBD94_01315 [Rickettsiales bacterium]|jgi:hypothetical protein|nr:hypothetical protein [Rickettsiales bacterium]
MAVGLVDIYDLHRLATHNLFTKFINGLVKEWLGIEGLRITKDTSPYPVYKFDVVPPSCTIDPTRIACGPLFYEKHTPNSNQAYKIYVSSYKNKSVYRLKINVGLVAGERRDVIFEDGLSNGDNDGVASNAFYLIARKYTAQQKVKR